MLQNFQNQEIINGQNFSRIADIVFAINIPIEDWINYDKNSYKIISKNDFYVGLKLKKLEVKNGDVIFCNSSYLDLLFKYLKRLKKINTLTLITGQSDISITEKIFSNKPKNITKWFAVNVEYNNPDLIPIPLGLANNYSPKNLRIQDFKNFTSQKVIKENKLYINLRTSTNLKEREYIKNIFINQNWVVIKEPNLSIEEYLYDLQKYKFVLCPWGNGIDTHRMWETLYAGSIPITKYHIGLTFPNLPIITVNSFKDLNIEFLISESKKLSHDLNQLNLTYWEKLIKQPNLLESVDIELIKEISVLELLYWNKIKIKKFFSSKLKKIKYYLKKILKILNYFL